MKSKDWIQTVDSMDQLFANKWVLIGVVVGALVLAVGLAYFFKSGSTSTAPPSESPLLSGAEHEDESEDQETEENTPLEGEAQPESVAPA